MSQSVEKDIRSQRERELFALREKGLAKTRKTNIRDIASSPMTTPEQASKFLASMRDQNKACTSEHKPPTNLSGDGVDAWYMMQRQREQELRRRREEASALLRGYRAPYQSDGRHKGRGRVSLGDEIYETLTDPGSPISVNKRRQSSMPRLENNWSNGSHEENRNPADDFDPLNQEQRFNDFRTDSDMFAFDDQSHTPSNRRVSFSTPPSHMSPAGREAPPSSYLSPSSSYLSSRKSQPAFDGSGLIDTSESQIRLNNAGRHSPLDSLPEVRDMDPVIRTKRDDVPETVWRSFVSGKTGAKFPPEKGRYHLYASYACPGSHRALIIRALKGLEDVVSVTIVHPTWRHTNQENPEDKHRGWVFGDPDGEPFQNTSGRGGPFPAAYTNNEPDPIMGAYSVRQLYEQADDTSGKYTIPMLWDTKTNTIVNNESSDISYMLNSCFNMYSSNVSLDLYTEDDEEGLDKLNEVSEWLYPMMIHGVYRCGFAKTQEAYDHAIEELTEAFDMADEILQGQRYLTGNTLTDADIRLFVTLLRFDEVYAFYFRANTRLVMLTPSLLEFCREIFQMPGVAETCHIDQIKAHFFGSHAEWNKYSVIPRGLGFVKLLELPHSRDKDLPLAS